MVAISVGPVSIGVPLGCRLEVAAYTSALGRHRRSAVTPVGRWLSSGVGRSWALTGRRASLSILGSSLLSSQVLVGKLISEPLVRVIARRVGTRLVGGVLRGSVVVNLLLLGVLALLGEVTLLLLLLGILLAPICLSRLQSAATLLWLSSLRRENRLGEGGRGGGIGAVVASHSVVAVEIQIQPIVAHCEV